MPSPTEDEVEASKTAALAAAQEKRIMLIKNDDGYAGVKRTGPEDRPFQALIKGMLSTTVLGNYVSAEAAALAYAEHKGSRLSEVT